MDSCGNIEECLKFLKGNSDEQRLVGLLLATKYVQGGDKDSILKVYDAIGIQFINRLLKSAPGTSLENKEQEQAYLQLALSILSAFCRVPELASLDEIINKIPLLLDILRKKPIDAVVADCFESLLGIGLASEKGLLCLQHSRGLSIVSQYLSSSAGDSVLFKSTIELVQLLSGGTVSEQEIAESADSIFSAISVLGKQLASEQGPLKFEALHLLQTLCSSKVLEASLRQVHLLKEAIHESAWLECIYLGLGQILQSQAAADQKHLVLELTESLVELFGTSWLLDPMFLGGETKDMPYDRFFILLVETLRVETKVLLNEVAWARFDLDYAAKCTVEESMKRQHVLATCYSLLENMINVIAEKSEHTSKSIEATFKKAITALNDTVGTAFEFLQEAKMHSLTKGDDLIASVRLIGRYLADAPLSHKKQFLQLLEYLFSVSPESGESSFLAVQFLLPALCQVTTNVEGCKALVSWGGHKQVVDYILSIFQAKQDPTGLIVEACDVILNVLQKENRVVNELMASDFLPIISVLPCWAANQNKTQDVSLAACICVMILDLTDEDTMLQIAPREALLNVYDLIIQILDYIRRVETSSEPVDEEDLWDLTVSTSVGIIDRYPSLNNAIRSSVWWQQFLKKTSSSEPTVLSFTVNPSVQSLLRSLLHN